MEYNGQFTYFGEKPRKRRGPSGFGIAVIILLVVLILLVTLMFVLRGANRFAEQRPTETPQPSATATQPPLVTPVPAAHQMPELDGTAPELDEEDPWLTGNPIPHIFEAVSPSVVGVINYATQTFGSEKLEVPYSTGSGFIISSDGFVLTNAHVIQAAERITVVLDSGEEVAADLIGADNETDVAVLKISHRGLIPVAIGNSDNVRIGEFVITIGNPIDAERLANTVTFGIISADMREITIDGHTNRYLQTDAAINFGNSGGPLLNMRGEVIGMNSAKTFLAGYDQYGNSIAAEGIGFALPINSVREIMEKLITDGSIERPAVGISVTTITKALAAEYRLPVSSGVYVASVVKGGPASQAGVLAGDIILSANGRKVVEQAELVAIIGECSVGDEIELEILRGSDTITCRILLGDKNQMDFDDVEPAE